MADVAMEEVATEPEAVANSSTCGLNVEQDAQISKPSVDSDQVENTPEVEVEDGELCSRGCTPAAGTHHHALETVTQAFEKDGLCIDQRGLGSHCSGAVHHDYAFCAVALGQDLFRHRFGLPAAHGDRFLSTAATLQRRRRGSFFDTVFSPASIA
eukprot:g19007.t1